MEKNVDKKNPLEELLKKHYVSGEQPFDYAGDAELEDYLDRLDQRQQEKETESGIYLDRLEQKRQEEEGMITPCINS